MKKRIELNEKFEDFIVQKRHSLPDTFVVLLNGSRMKTLRGLYHELEAALQFPSYFGGNWNAVDDCLKDFLWLKEKNYLIAIMNFQEILTEYEYDPKEKIEEMEYFLDCLITPINYWHTPKCPDEWFGHTYRDFDVYVEENNEVYQLLPDD